eukprot:660109-Prorocentrum_minimum.AAC.2
MAFQPIPIVTYLEYMCETKPFQRTCFVSWVFNSSSSSSSSLLLPTTWQNGSTPATWRSATRTNRGTPRHLSTASSPSVNIPALPAPPLDASG